MTLQPLHTASVSRWTAPSVGCQGSFSVVICEVVFIYSLKVYFLLGLHVFMYIIVTLKTVCLLDQMQGTVTLRNISTSTSGLYQCTSSNAIGKSTCVLNVQVVARK